MRDFVLMTDSCCDLTDYMANDLALEVLPLTVHMADKDYPNYLDGRALSRETFYHMLRNGTLGTTSAVNIGAFEEAMSRVLSQGKDIVCVCFSGALSTTYQSAVIAAKDLISEYPDSRIYVIDSLSASLGQGLLLYLAAGEKRQGRSADQVAEFIENTKGQICHWITVDDLHYLKMGGRVSTATALLGTMLSVKPVLHLDDTGHLLHSGLQGVAAERFECGGMAVVQRNGGLFALETQAGVLVCQTLCGGGNGLQVRCIHCKQQPGSTASPGTMFTGNGQMQRRQKLVYVCNLAARDDGQRAAQPSLQGLEQKR